jgi:hypothetical protein
MDITFPPPVWNWNEATRCTAFAGERRLAAGALAEVAAKVKASLEDNDDASKIFIFDDTTARPIELDFRGSVRAVLNRIAKAPPEVNYETDEVEIDPATRKPGRPRLGVQAREVTLLPRHWEWLSQQPGGSSAALRRLVDAARRTSGAADRKRRAQETAHRFMTAMAGNRPGYEEALRALYAGDEKSFLRRTAPWPEDVRDYARTLAREAFATSEPGDPS